MNTSKVTRTTGKALLYLKKSLPTILTGLSVVGVVATTVMTAKATVKAVDILEQAEIEKGETLTKTEKIVKSAPVYVPAFLLMVATVFCVASVNVTNKRLIAGLISAYELSDKTFMKYREKVEELYGDEADNRVREELTKDDYKEKDIPKTEDKCLFYEPFSGEFFERTKEEVVLAEYHFNRNFAIRGYAVLNELYSFLDLPNTDFGEVMGWSFDVGICEGWCWIDFDHTKIYMDDGRECYVITMPFAPREDYEDIDW